MKKKGISLIALIITIVVVIILASAAVLVLDKEDNVFDNADELQFKQNILSYKEELEDYISNVEFESNGRIDIQAVDAAGSELRIMIPDIKDEDINTFKIENGQLKYIGASGTDKSKWASEVLD